MKSLLVISTAFFGMIVTACMAGEPAQSDPDQASAATSTPAASTTATDESLTLQPAACQVIWHRCSDPDHGGRATFCTNGECGGDPTAQAQALCNADCGAGTQCNPGNLLQLGAGC